MKTHILITVLSGLLATICNGCSQNPEKSYKEAESLHWKKVFHDDFKDMDTTAWHLDGLRGSMKITPEGLVLSAGNMINANSDHVVLWNTQEYKGDIRVEYDFTRLDTCSTETVNIIYLHANGSGADGYSHDIMEWNDRRTVPAMSTYFNHMNAFHISYAVEKGDTLKADYVRGRRYMPETGKGLAGTALRPEYENTGLFRTGITYHITVIKRGSMLFMNVAGDGKEKLFHFDLSSHPDIDGGRTGLRQMWGRTSRYADFKVFQPDK